MADQSDVEDALVALVSAALYPHGTGENSIPGPDCRVYRGWPNSAALDADLAAGRVNVTVFPGGSTGRTTTRYSQQWVGLPTTPSLKALVSCASVTFSGQADIGQVAGILVDSHSHAYRTRAGDTPDLVAANLASMARSHSIVLLLGSTLTIAGAGNLVARVVADSPVQQELRRQEQNFRITCWCSDPAVRDSSASAIDQSLGSMSFIKLSDDTCARLIYVGTTIFDQSQNARLYRRDLSYDVEYAMTASASQPAMLFGDLALNSAHITA